jgi:hypothetical protein
MTYSTAFSNLYVGNFLVGPHAWIHRITGNQSLDFILHDLPKLLEHIPLALWTRKWYMHNGAQAHFGHTVREVPGRWMGREGHQSSQI